MAAAASAPLPSLLAADAPAVKIMSFNVRYINSEDKGARTWTARRDWVGEIVRRENPDVLGVQEAQRPILDDIAQRVPGYREIGCGREDGKSKGEYSAILVRKDAFEVLECGTFWLSDTPEVPGSCSWGNRVTRICTWAALKPKSGPVFHVFNAHFDHESQPAREKAALLITERIQARKPAGPFVFTGDLNAGEQNPVIQQLKSGPLKLRDSWRELHPDVPPAESGTMHGFSGKHDKAKIDYIFIPPGVTAVKAAIVRDQRESGETPSDHFPVTAEIRF